MPDFPEARKLGALDGTTWASTRAPQTLISALADASSTAIAQKQAMFRLITFLDQTFRDRNTEQVLREALGIKPEDDLAAAQAQYEDAWLEAVKQELSGLKEPGL